MYVGVLRVCVKAIYIKRIQNLEHELPTAHEPKEGDDVEEGHAHRQASAALLRSGPRPRPTSPEPRLGLPARDREAKCPPPRTESRVFLQSNPRPRPDQDRRNGHGSRPWRKSEPAVERVL